MISAFVFFFPHVLLFRYCDGSWNYVACVCGRGVLWLLSGSHARARVDMFVDDVSSCCAGMKWFLGVNDAYFRRR